MAGRLLQSLEHHAAELQQRRKVQTELRAWVEQVLTQDQQDFSLESSWGCGGAADVPAAAVSSGRAAAQQRHHPGQAQQHEQDIAHPGDAVSREQQHHHHRHHCHHRHQRRRQHKQHDKGPAAAAAEEAQTAAREVLLGSSSCCCQEQAQQKEQTCEHEVVAQLRLEQQQLLALLQQAHEHIAQLTAAQGVQPDNQPQEWEQEEERQQQQGDTLLQPSPGVQVLQITRSSGNAEEAAAPLPLDAAGLDAEPLEPRTGGSSSRLTPRALGKAAAGKRPPATGAAAGTPRGTATTAAAASKAAGRRSPRGTKALPDSSRSMAMPPSGRGLSLAQQQAVQQWRALQKPRESTDVMEPLQQDLQAALAAKQAAAQPQQERQEAGAESSSQDRSSSEAAGSRSTGVQCEDTSEAQVQTLQQQVQKQAGMRAAACQELARATEAAAAAQHEAAGLQQQLSSQQEQWQQHNCKLQAQLDAAHQAHAVLLARLQEQCGSKMQAPAAPASGTQGCCMHVKECRQLQQTVAALRAQPRLQQPEPVGDQQRPQTARPHGRQHLLQLKTWLCPPSAHATLPASARPATPPCSSSRGLQLDALVPPGECRLRPLTHRAGATAEPPVLAQLSRWQRRLSADAEQRLLSAVTVAAWRSPRSSQHSMSPGLRAWPAGAGAGAGGGGGGASRHNGARQAAPPRLAGCLIVRSLSQ
jgi:hypothetical protein